MNTSTSVAPKSTHYQPSKCDQYYFNKNDRQHGPVTRKTLERHHRKGHLTADSLIRQEGTNDWVELKTLLKEPSTSFGEVFILFCVVAAGAAVLMYYLKSKDTPENNLARQWKQVNKAQTMPPPINKTAYFRRPIMGCTSLDELKYVVTNIRPYPTSLTSKLLQRKKGTGIIYRFPREWLITGSGEGYWIGERHENFLRINPWSGKTMKTEPRWKKFYISNREAEKYFSHAK